MSLDSRIRSAIDESVDSIGQDAGLANKLAAWFEAIASGNERLDDRDSVDRHLEILFGAVMTEIADDEGKGEESWESN